MGKRQVGQCEGREKTRALSPVDRRQLCDACITVLCRTRIVRSLPFCRFAAKLPRAATSSICGTILEPAYVEKYFGVW